MATSTFASLIQVISSVGLGDLALNLKDAGIKSVDDIRSSRYRVPRGIPPKAWHTITTAAGCGVPLGRQTVEEQVATQPPTITSYQPNFAGVVKWLNDNHAAEAAEHLRTCGIKRPADLLSRREAVLSDAPDVLRQVLKKRLETQAAQAHEATPRGDFPTIRTTSRGCIHAALEASLPQHRQAALEDIESCKYANSSRHARDVQWRTWCRLADSWSLPPIPITIELVDRIAASLRRGGYRSSANYFARARDEHLRQIGSPVSHLISYAIKQAIRAVDRGALAQTPKEAFELETFAGPCNPHSSFADDKVTMTTSAIPNAATNNYADSKVFAVRFTILGCWWMTREIEIAAATIGDIEVRHTDKTVRWRLPASKADQSGRGVVRAHGCACKAEHDCDKHPHNYTFYKICPYHQMCAHLSDLGETRPTSPLFPTSTGQFTTKEKSIGLIRAAVTEVFGDSEEAARIDRLGGHSLRVSGAQAMARTGIDTTLIQMIGRWGSATVLRYIQDAPLERSHLIASSFARCCSSSNLVTESSTLSSAPTIEDAVPAATATRQLHDSRPAPSDPPLEEINPSGVQFAPGDDFVQNPRTGLIHRSRGPLVGDCNTWSLRCGWNFLRSAPGYSILGKKLPAGNRCPRCFRLATAETHESSSDSDSESSDSSS